MRWIAAVIGWLVLITIYGIWRELDKEIGGGFVSGFLRGVLIYGSAYYLYRWAKQKGPQTQQVEKSHSLMNDSDQEKSKTLSPISFNEENAWEEALQEFESSERKKGIWAKAFSDSNGDEGKAKAYYLKTRVKQLIDSHNNYVHRLQLQESKQRKKEEDVLLLEKTKKIKTLKNREYAEYEDGSCVIETRWGEKKKFSDIHTLKKYIGNG